jgi:hypothetical protein
MMAFIGNALVLLLTIIGAFAVCAYATYTIVKYINDKKAKTAADEMMRKFLTDAYGMGGDISGFTIISPLGEVQQVPAPESTKANVVEVGHFLPDCSCEACHTSAQGGGINMGPFLDSNGNITQDYDQVLNVTSPIVSCFCTYCKRRREVGWKGLTLAEAHTELEELNKQLGYSL